ncbi:MAG: signal peptidase II, partial [Firmicutes bacterium]|nr:signal peptidase II [Candidatus Onthovivens merdipullorum]
VMFAVPIYIVYLMTKDKSINTFFGIALALVLGGDVGNLIDRTFFFDRGVVDFISIQSWFPNFGIFNIADACLVVGVLMLLGYLIYDEIKTSKEDKEHKENIKKLEEKEQSNLNNSETISSVTNENDE